jgi:hypothetical protein
LLQISVKVKSSSKTNSRFLPKAVFHPIKLSMSDVMHLAGIQTLFKLVKSNAAVTVRNYFIQ